MTLMKQFWVGMINISEKLISFATRATIISFYIGITLTTANMKRFVLVQLFAAVVLLASCGKAEQVSDGTTDDNSSQTAVATKISSLNGIVPVVTMAGGRADKMYRLEPKTALFTVRESNVDCADLKLEYEWVDGRNSCGMVIEIPDVPYVISDDGLSISVTEEPIPGTVTYIQGWQFKVETMFTIEAANKGGLETVRLSLSSKEVVLEVREFSDKQLSGKGTWAIIDRYLRGKEVYVNGLEENLTISLLPVAVRPSFEGMTFTLLPGESKEVEVTEELGYPGIGGVLVDYGQEKIELNHQEGDPLSLYAKSEHNSTLGLYRDFEEGFLRLLRYPIDTFTFSAETLAK